MTAPTRTPVTAMVFTLDEELNLPRCLQSLSWCDDLVVVDSFSTDRTEEIARGAGARFFQRRFDGFGSQRNWALANTEPAHEWVLILDADERVPGALAEEIDSVVRDTHDDVAAYQVRRRFHFWGQWLRYSSLYPNWVVRLVRRDRICYVNRGHAETQQVDGDVAALEHDLIDENHKGLDAWFDRQRSYARQEAEFELAMQQPTLSPAQLWSSDPLARRAAQKRLAASIPARPLAYFVYSYLWRGGFRDGRAGLYFCLMKALYQGMIAVNKYDLRRRREDPS